MNVTALYSDRSALSLAQIYGTQAADTASSDTTQTTGTGASSQADSLDLSKPGELYSKLQQLAETDPEKLREVCADIAEQLRTASEEQTGQGSKMLSDLAEKFQSVADGGDVSELKPPAPPQGPPPGGAGGMIGKYTEQEDQSVVNLLNSSDSDDSRTTLDELLESFIEEVNAALA